MSTRLDDEFVRTVFHGVNAAVPPVKDVLKNPSAIESWLMNRGIVNCLHFRFETEFIIGISKQMRKWSAGLT